MKRVLSIVLSITMVLSGCFSVSINNIAAMESENIEEISFASEEEMDSNVYTEEMEADSSVGNIELQQLKEFVPSFTGMDDPDLLNYTENAVYANLVKTLNSDEYFVENVEAVYISQEYLEELAYNSQANIFFGYTLEELSQQFQGDRYVFTLGDNGETIVKKMETDYDDSAERIMKNVAIGGGVIVLCVTVSIVSAGAGAPAVSMIFAVGAETAKTYATSAFVIGGVSAAITTGYQTGDPEEALKAGLLAGSEGFKWGAISGAIVGGGSTAVALHGATLNGLTMNEAAAIQMESGYPLDVIKEFHTVKEYEAFRNANLSPTMVGNKSALIKTDIDLTRIDAKGRTNLERMKQGLAPKDASGISYDLHHIGQKKDGTLAILTRSEHDNPAIHGFLQRSEAHAPGTNWDAERQAFWKAFVAMVG